MELTDGRAGKWRFGSTPAAEAAVNDRRFAGAWIDCGKGLDLDVDDILVVGIPCAVMRSWKSCSRR